LISLSQAGVRYCCVGSAPSVIQYRVDLSTFPGENKKCYSLNGNYAWAGDNPPSGASTCATDYCNCPPEAHKTQQAMGWFFGDMRRIMYPIMGIIFGLLWVILAFIGGGPATILLMITALLDAIFGIFLIFLPVTTFLGLFYVAIGAFTIAIAKHSVGGSKGIYFLITLTVLIFLLTGGLTFFAYPHTNYIDQIAASIANCESSMNIINWDNNYWNLDTRCENWALFEAFAVFFLFLLQPLAILELFFKMSSGGGGGGGGGGSGGSGGQSAGHSTQNTNAQ
jgi:hypothetical protein